MRNLCHSFAFMPISVYIIYIVLGTLYFTGFDDGVSGSVIWDFWHKSRLAIVLAISWQDYSLIAIGWQRLPRVIGHTCGSLAARLQGLAQPPCNQSAA